MKYVTEYTDTFGGDANYSWANRKEFEAPENATRRQLIRLAKEALGISGRFRLAWDCGDTIRYNEQGACRCLFIWWEV